MSTTITYSLTDAKALETFAASQTHYNIKTLDEARLLFVLLHHGACEGKRQLWADAPEKLAVQCPFCGLCHYHDFHSGPTYMSQCEFPLVTPYTYTVDDDLPF